MSPDVAAESAANNACSAASAASNSLANFFSLIP